VGVFEVDTFGKLKDISRFDAPFFNFSADQANQCAPDVRIMLEVAWETIVDAGYDPKNFENTPTGVYIGSYFAIH
jgi:acyl transferase domain-containing protein